MTARLLGAWLSCAILVFADPKPELDRISADSLRGHVSFLASDLLEGRDTPSRGLDLAAEYIATQFRRAGLKPMGDDGYFQTSKWLPALELVTDKQDKTARLRGRGGPDQAVYLRNVIGLLPGSDPTLSETCVAVTAHYDHVGIATKGEGDRIFNGANDNASGVATVIELAAALAASPERPKRSVLFMAVFGEEKGLLGSRYYVRHPAFPLEKTVAVINLEQLGRTDSSEGPQISKVSVTGFGYSDVGGILKAAGEATGVEVSGEGENADSYFARSDNVSFADQGIPAHTISTSYEFPDYHQPGDEWSKIDYDNMVKVGRMVALGVLNIADSATEPAWNEKNSNAERYVKARQKRQEN